MHAKLIQKSVGPWPMNTYVVICESSRTSAIIDPGADPDSILALIDGTKVDKILITHGHPDHVSALDDIISATGAPVYLHPAEAEIFQIKYDFPLSGDSNLRIGKLVLKTFHTPGHTPGQICFDLGDGRIIVGDTLFVGGPGKTWSSKDFATTMLTMQKIVFSWPEETQFFPGHGSSGKISAERPAFEAFLTRGWPVNTFGDVAW